MRARVLLLIVTLAWSSLISANDINISTIADKDGNTLFFLQAGAYPRERDANLRKQELSTKIQEHIEVRRMADKRLFLVQIGPISDYPTARTLKNQLAAQAPQAKSRRNTLQAQLPIKDEPIKTTDKVQEALPLESKNLPQDSKLWNLRNADIRAVIAEISRVTGKNFVIDPRVQGKVSIVSSTPMNNKELYQVFLSVLQVSGYAAIPTGDVIKIVPNIDAKTFSGDQLNALKHPPQGEDMLVSVVPVHYVPADQLVPVLRPLMPQWSAISSYGPSNMIILSGRANNIKMLTDIIKQVDSSNSSGIDMVPLKHTLAMDIAATLKDLVKSQPNSPSRTQISVSADDKSNSILISGSKTDRIRLRMLIMKLDKISSAPSNSTTQVVYLNYLRSEDLVPILAGIAQANFSGNVGTTIGTITRPPLDSTNPAASLVSSNPGSSSGSSTANSTTAQPTVANTPAAANTQSASTQNEGSTKPTIQIIAEPNTNSIILNAPASVIRTLKEVIGKLDIKPEQILIEALVAEVNEEAVRDLGIEWGSNQQTGNPGNFRPGFAIVNSKTSINDFQAQIYALATEHKANILSTPSVVVLDNRQAKILVGKQVSVASTSYPNNAGGTTVASPYTTFDRVNVALHLYVRPQITRDHGIQMQIDQGNDTLDPVSSIPNTTTPTFSISAIVTSVHVETGDIIVLGGLNQDSLANNNRSIPILSGIPGIGRLFQRNSRNREKRVLMVFIRPTIIRNAKDSYDLTSVKYNQTREYELAWVRSQEVFNQADNETVLPPLNMEALPTPFTPPPSKDEK